MVSVDIYFYFEKEKISLLDLEDELEGLLIDFKKYYFITGQYSLLNLGNAYRASILTPLLDNDKKSDFPAELKSEMNSIRDKYSLKIEVKKLYDNEKVDYASEVDKADSYYLFTHLFSIYSPLKSAASGYSIAPYLLGIKRSMVEQMYAWQRRYKVMDSLWMDSGELEVDAYKEMSVIESPLNKKGLDICRQVEDVIKKPVYYFIFKYYGRNFVELERLCPSCGQEWYNEEFKEDSEIMKMTDNFAYICHKCKLISLETLELNLRRAHIGEFSGNDV